MGRDCRIRREAAYWGRSDVADNQAKSTDALLRRNCRKGKTRTEGVRAEVTDGIWCVEVAH